MSYFMLPIGQNHASMLGIFYKDLAAILKEKGFPIARRTIAKYREQLDIPVARLRKKM